MTESKIAKVTVLLCTAFLGGAVLAAEAILNTDIPDDVIAKEEKILNLISTQQSAQENDLNLEQIQRSVDQYHASIAQLQRFHGVFYDQIGEVLMGLGLAYKNLGQHQQAGEAFNRALHINRVNHGLYNPGQLAILEAIVEVNTAIGDWETLDKNYHLYYWVNRRIFGLGDPRLLPVIDRLGRWHLNAYTLKSDPIPFKHLLSADELFKDATEIIETNYGPYDQRLISPLYGIAMTNYQVAYHAATNSFYNDLSFSSNNSSRMERMLEEEEARQELISEAYRNGKNAMVRINDIYSNNPELPADDHGIALIHLGDWYLLFNRRNSASDTYALAYSKLAESGMPKTEIDRLFAKPRSLPAIRLPVEYQREEDVNENYVIARFDVSESGQARNIEIIESSPTDNESLRRRAKSTIRATRFRPRIEDGQPVATPGVNIRYVFHE